MLAIEQRRKGKLGFTLMEVMVALALFSVSVLVLTQSFVNGLMCKENLSKENTYPLVYQLIRSELGQLSRDNVPMSHVLFYPDNENKINWQGTIEFSDISDLYKVKVFIKEANESVNFWVCRPDWMSPQEKSIVSSSIQKVERENVKL